LIIDYGNLLLKQIVRNGDRRISCRPTGHHYLGFAEKVAHKKIMMLGKNQVYRKINAPVCNPQKV
jgi:HKD family nuclease